MGRVVVQKKATEITRFRQQFRAEHLIGEQEWTAPQHHNTKRACHSPIKKRKKARSGMI